MRVASKVVRWVDTKVDERAAARVDMWECKKAAPRVDLKGVSRVAYSVVERVGHLDDKLADRWADCSAASSVDLKGASKVAYWVVERVGHLDDKLADK